MNKAVLLCVVLVGCAGTPGPCPEGQARDNAGQCVAIAVPQQSLEDFDPFPQAKPDPASDGIVFVANAELDAENARRQAEWDRARERLRDNMEADERADRIVDAQRDTQRAVQELSDKVRQ